MNSLPMLMLNVAAMVLVIVSLSIQSVGQGMD
jgi:hypothetical protein